MSTEGATTATFRTTLWPSGGNNVGIVVPDDVHESMLHRRWLYTWRRMGDFLHRFVRNRETPPRS